MIAKNLSSENYDEETYEEAYYYADAGDTDTIPLKSKGVVTSSEGDKVWVKIDDEEYPFHRRELEFLDLQITKFKSLPSYVFNLASQMPVFVLNDRVYVLGEAQEDSKENFFQTTKTVHSLEESASLKSLEELAESHFSKEFENFRNEYLQEVIEEKEDAINLKIEEDSEDSYKLVDFIVNKVFPYLRNKAVDKSKINKLFGVNEVDEEIKNDSESLDKTTKNKNEVFISKLITKIEKEKFPVKKNKKQKATKRAAKLDAILGYVPDLEVDINNLPQNYSSESVLGNIVEGRNVAIIDNVVYHLVESKDDKHEQILNFKGVNYFLVSPIPVDELKNKFYFELSKKVRIETLKTKVAKDEQIRELLENDSNLSGLVRKDEYFEDDFGFIRNEEYEYHVFLKVPKHVLKMPDDYEFDDYDETNYDKNGILKKKRDRFYFFDKVRVAVKVFFEDGEIQYDKTPVTVEEYEHPFADGGEYDVICLGFYPDHELNKLSSEEAIVKLLKDTKTTLLSGYVSGDTTPINRLEYFEDRRISPSEIKKRNLPITNINLGG